MRTRTAVAVTLMTVVCIGLSVAAQKNPKAEKPPSKWPGIAEFRSECDLSTADSAAICSPDNGDRIVGDPNSHDGTGDLLVNYLFVPEHKGAGMYSVNGNLHIALAEPRYRLLLDFGDPADPDTRPCLSGSTACRWPHSGKKVVVERAEVQSAVLDQSGNRVANGLWSIPYPQPEGQTFRSELRIGFTTLEPYQWQLRFQPALYAGADDVDVRRTAKCTWVFTTDGDALAGLNGWGSDPNSKGGKNATTNEGLFRMPTEITLTLVQYDGYSMHSECK